MRKLQTNRGQSFWPFIGVLVILWFVWFATGGPNRPLSQGGPFLKPPAPIDTGESYGPRNLGQGQSGNVTVSSREPTAVTHLAITNPSFFAGSVQLDVAGGQLQLVAPADSRNTVNVSGWKITNNRGLAYTLPSSPILISAGQSYIVTLSPAQMLLLSNSTIRLLDLSAKTVDVISVGR